MRYAYRAMLPSPGPLARRLSSPAFGLSWSFNARDHYAEDGLYTVHNQGFRRDPRFRDAYARGVAASGGVDGALEWRVHVALWAALTALRVRGDFVECGVNAGVVSSAVMRYLDFAALPRTYYLVDTFTGPVLAQYSAAETRDGMSDRARACSTRRIRHRHRPRPRELRGVAERRRRAGRSPRRAG